MQYSSSFVFGKAQNFEKLVKNARSASDRVFPAIKRCYLMSFSLSNLTLLCKNEDSVLINGYKLLKIHSIGHEEIIGKRDRFHFENVLQICKVYREFPAENELEMKEGPLFICDSVGKIWYFDQDLIPKYEETKGEMYQEKLIFPQAGNICKPVPHEISMHFGDDKHGLVLSFNQEMDLKVDFKIPKNSLESKLLSSRRYIERINELNYNFIKLKTLIGI